RQGRWSNPGVDGRVLEGSSDETNRSQTLHRSGEQETRVDEEDSGRMRTRQPRLPDSPRQELREVHQVRFDKDRRQLEGPGGEALIVRHVVYRHEKKVPDDLVD